MASAGTTTAEHPGFFDQDERVTEPAGKAERYWTMKRRIMAGAIGASMLVSTLVGAWIQRGVDENARQNSTDTMLNLAHRRLLPPNVIDFNLNRDTDVARVKVATSAGQICTGSVAVEDSGEGIRYAAYDAAGELQKGPSATTAAQIEAVFNAVAENSRDCHPANG